MKAGYLYIITNPAFESWVKVGITENLKKRLEVYQTCDPARGYKLEYSLYHPKYKEAEKKIKEMMYHFATEIKGEWFKIPLHMAKSRLEEQLSDYENKENGYSGD